MKTQYDYDYFFNKFSAIPDEQWCTGTYTLIGSHCALGHCGVRDGALWTDEGKALAALFGDDLYAGMRIAAINDAFGYGKRFKQPTPKQRILAALDEIKARAEAALEQYEDRPLLPALPHDSGASSGTSQSRRFPARPVKVISASGPAPTGETAGAVPCCPMIGSTALLSGSSPDSPKPLSPVPQEQVSATDATQLGLCASVAGRQA